MFRNLMLWWRLTTGVYCVGNEDGCRASGHSTMVHDVELAFAICSLILFEVVRHDYTASAVG